MNILLYKQYIQQLPYVLTCYWADHKLRKIVTSYLYTLGCNELYLLIISSNQLIQFLYKKVATSTTTATTQPQQQQQQQQQQQVNVVNDDQLKEQIWSMYQQICIKINQQQENDLNFHINLYLLCLEISFLKYELSGYQINHLISYFYNEQIVTQISKKKKKKKKINV